jgi:serine protease SohB
MAFVAEYGMFLAKTVTWLAAILVVIGAITTAARARREAGHGYLEIRHVNERLRDWADALNDQLLSPTELKKQAADRKKAAKLQQKAIKSGQSPKSRVFVLDFDGDVQASAVDTLREEISSVLQVARSGDEVVLRLESPGGLVHAYGLAASQLQRIREAQFKLTICVDKVAASGGYMMACVGDQILAAPFAVIGSIGVVAQLPNFSRLLRKHEIDFELHTAGEHKRTLTVFGENTEAGRAKFREEIEETHTLFKRFVSQNRSILDIAKVATGEHWYGTQALALKLVDRIVTSDDYLLEKHSESEVYEIRYKRPRALSQRLQESLTRLLASGRPNTRLSKLELR